MPPEPEVDEEYASSEDSDFAPDDAPDRASSPESDDDAAAETGKPAAAKRKRADGAADAEDAGFENSGDEAIIEKGAKRQKKTKVRFDVDDDDGGEGHLIKTRSQRAQEKVERKAAVAQGPVTIDVDALWLQMIAGTIAAAKRTEDECANDGEAQPDKETDGAVKTNAAEPSEMIKIKRTYKYGTEIHTEERMVARDSAEAKLYLASLGDKGEVPEDDDQPPKRMPRKAFRSAFEPVMDQFQRADLNLGMAMRLQARELAKTDVAKLTTVQKSRLDWAGFVDREGIQDELALAGKSKGNFAERQDFLARSEARKEEESRRARQAARA